MPDERERDEPTGYFGLLSARWHAYFAARDLKKRLQIQNKELDSYQKELSEWQEEYDQLRQELQLANLPTGLTATSDRVPIVLHKGESVFLVMTTALVEPKKLPGHWVGGYSGVSLRMMKGVTYHVGGSRGAYVPGPELPLPIAVGITTITNQRVVFQSDLEAREFPFSKLIGYQHDPQEPLTYFQLSNRKKVSGIGYSAENARFLRFRLSLALAHFRGEVPALVKHLKREIEQHDVAMPQAPSTLLIYCESCGKSFQAISDLAGNRVKCHNCKHLIDIPNLDEPFDRFSVKWKWSREPWHYVAAVGVVFLLSLILLFSFSRKHEPVTVAEFQGAKPPQPTTDTKVIQASVPARLAHLDKCYQSASSQGWGKSIQQIPATVIDKGILKYVPYQSFKCGDYEINIYGDPDSPACVEIGIRNELLKSQEAKTNCIQFIQLVLNTSEDRVFLVTLKREKDLKKRGGLTFEITPETDEDAYGGWWVSVYDETLLTTSRASNNELKQITLTREEIKQQTQPNKDEDTSKWNASDLTHARQVTPTTSQSGGGQVYVKGYTKKDGTYVPAYTRSTPSRGRR